MTLFDLSNKILKAHRLKSLSEEDSFWNDNKKAVKILNELNQLTDTINDYNEIKLGIDNLIPLINSKDINNLEIQELADLELENLENKIEEFRKEILFSNEYDNLNATIDIHPGAGGTESHDWASMLYRMYVRFAERHHFSMQILDFQAGEEAGISSVTISIRGKNVYGMLKGEKGVHRLVRISPFDSNGRRHTSFASVNVVPEFNDTIDIEILDKDLKVDTFRSSGAGGQNVNKVNSAVRMTHLPTGIVVSCQMERSQLSNREMCITMLKNELYQRELKIKENKMKGIVGVQKNIEWGSQIRSYVFCPYTLVKDHRTSFERSDVDNVLDGDIDNFIYHYLEKEVAKDENI